MGDMCEDLLMPNQAFCFYKITSSEFKFEIKSQLRFSIFLSSTKGSKYDYEISLGDHPNARSWIEPFDGDRHIFPLPDVRNADNIRKFWITWYGGHVRLGHNETLMSLARADNARNLQYVRFMVQKPSVVRMELSPIEEKKNFKRFADAGLPEWKACTDQLPPGAAIGGFEREPLYLIRAAHSGSITPGKFVPSEGTAYVSWGGDAHAKEDFEALCGYNFRWVATAHDRLPPGAVAGGRSEVDNEVLYIGRARHQNCLIPGKVQLTHKVCYVPFDEREIAKWEYEVLTIDNRHSRFARAPSTSPDGSPEGSGGSDDDDSAPRRSRMRCQSRRMRQPIMRE